MGNATNKVFPLAELEALDFAEVIDSLMPVKAGIIRGCAVQKSTTAGYVWVTAGQVLVRGRLITVSGGNVFLPVPSGTSQTYYIIVECDLSASTLEGSASVKAVTALEGEGRQNPSSNNNINPSSLKTYVCLGRATRSQTAVTTVDATGRVPVITNIGNTVYNTANTANNRSQDNSKSITGSIANRFTALTTKITNNYNSLLSKIKSLTGVKSSHQVGCSVEITSLAAGASITVVAYPGAGTTYYPASATGSKTERQNYQMNQAAISRAENLWDDANTRGTLETFVGLGGITISGANSGGIVLRGWNCVTGSKTDRHQYVTLYLRNTGSQAATGVTLNVKGYFTLVGAFA